MLKSVIHISFSIFLALITISGIDKNSPKNKNLYSEEDRILVVAHRGSHSYFPENSLGSIGKSIENGIDIVEIDIRETRDKVPVLLHDGNLKRTTGVNKDIRELHFEELEQYPLLFNGASTDYRIPSLEMALKAAREKVILNLDFKLNDLNAIKRTYHLIEKHKMEGSVILTLRNYKFIPELYKLNPEIRLMPVAYNRRKINKVLKYDHLDIIQLYHRKYAKRCLKDMQNRKIQIWVNALNKYDELEMNGKKGFEELINIKKVDMIQTDHPEELLSFLQEKGLHD